MSRRNADRLLAIASGSAAVVAGAIFFAVVWVISVGALPGLAAYGVTGFLADATWVPADGRVGAWGMIAGSLAVTAVALLVAVPLGVFGGIASGWLLPSSLASTVRLIAIIIAGLPSVVVGLWGLTALVPVIGHLHAPGLGLLAAGLVLALMVAPLILLVTDAALRSVPAEHRRAAQSLGLSSWGCLRVAGLPALRHGAANGTVLAFTRAIGETMAVVMVAGNIVAVPHSIFDPIRTLTGGVALEMAYATGTHRSALFTLGLVAMLLVAGVLLALRCLPTLSAERSTPGAKQPTHV